MFLRALLSMTNPWRRCLSNQDDSETEATEKGLGVG